MYKVAALVLGSMLFRRLGWMPQNYLSVFLRGAVAFFAVIAGGMLLERGGLLRKPLDRLLGRDAEPPKPEEGMPYKFFDVRVADQGTLVCPMEAKRLMDHLEQTSAEPVTVVVYVHGWQHNVKSPHRMRFEALLAKLVTDRPETSPNRIVGVYLSWTGQTFLSVFKRVSFWDRQETLSDVAQGGVREVLERLRVWRYGLNAALPAAAATPPHVSRLLVVIGHSFGGAIVFRALSQSFFGIVADGRALRPPADTVLLINPALPAYSYLPLHEMITGHCLPAARPDEEAHRFRFLAVTAKNDKAVGLSFPIASIGRLYSRKAVGPLGKQARLRGLGFVDAFRTGRLSLVDGKPVLQAMPGHRDNELFQIVSASSDIVDGHNGIDKQTFINWVCDTIRSDEPGAP